MEVEYSILTGQSYTLASQGSPALTLTPRWPDNVTQVLASNDAVAEGHPFGTRVTLQEGDSWDAADDSQRPSSTLGYGIYEHRRLTGPSAQVTLTSAGLGGAELSEISQGTSVYNDHLARLGAAVPLADTLRVYMLHLMQGERDQIVGTTEATYLTNLQALYDDYNTDCKAATGQSQDIIGMVQDQMDFDRTLTIGRAQLKAHRQFAFHYLAGPRYHIPRAGDDLHLSNVGYYKLGEIHARAHGKIRDGGWEPVHPWNISLDGQVVTIRFHVPVMPLVFDTATVPSVTNRGFSYHDTADPSAAGPMTADIVGVSIEADSVVIELDDVPAGADPHIGYGEINRHGNLRDSDPYASQYDGAPLRNWCCHFYDPIDYQGSPPIVARVTGTVETGTLTS